MPCIFCGSAGPLTDEHALPRWARKAIGATTAQVRYHVEAPGARRISAPTGPPQRTFTGMVVLARKALCGPCNTGWLAELERDVGPLLAPAMRGDRIQLSADEQRLVAFWAVKTSLLVEVASRQSRAAGVMPTSHLRWLYEHRVHREPPPGTVVWLSSLNPWFGDTFVPTWCSSGVLRSSDPSVHADRTNDSYVATFSVGCLVFQVIGQDFRESDYRTPTGLPFVTVIPPRKLAPYLLPIWPEGHPVASWPPNYLILAEDWIRFAEWYTVLTWFQRSDPATGEIIGIFLAERRTALPPVRSGGPPRAHRTPPEPNA